MLKNIIIGVLLLGAAAAGYRLHLRQTQIGELLAKDKELQQKIDDQQVHILSMDSTGGSTTTTVLVSDLANGAPMPDLTVSFYTPDANGAMTLRGSAVTNSSGSCQAPQNCIGGNVSTDVKVFKGTSLLTMGNFVSRQFCRR